MNDVTLLRRSLVNMECNRREQLECSNYAESLRFTHPSPESFYRITPNLKRPKPVCCQNFILKSFIITILLQNVHNDRVDDSTTRFKISPTRIRLSSIGSRYLPASSHRFIDRTNQPNEDLKKSTEYRLARRRRQMAPAYELWPNINLELNRVRPTAEFIPKFEKQPLSADILNERVIHPPASRSVLPRPLFSSESHQRFMRIRSTEEDEDSETSPDNEIKPSDAEDDVEDSTSLKDPSPSNHVVIASEDATEKLESRKLAVSQVYPPGDLDRLYSDALLVYVKDFNQYIKR